MLLAIPLHMSGERKVCELDDVTEESIDEFVELLLSFNRRRAR